MFTILIILKYKRKGNSQKVEKVSGEIMGLLTPRKRQETRPATLQ